MADEAMKKPGQGLPPLPPGALRPAPVRPEAPPAEDPAKKIADLETRLQAEREKVLLANLKSQEEAVAAARVEGAIKDVQERLRRDRRDADQEETRLRLEARIQELENRLTQERETWVATLKSQMAVREVQDKEIETHFTARIQEMERRWLEEKAHWQRALLSKEEEIRAGKGAQERLKQIDLEHQRLGQEKRFLEERLNELNQSHAALQAKMSGASEREREFFQLKAELDKARDHARMEAERHERDVQSLRAENDRLGRDLAAADQRARASLKAEYDEELKKARGQAEVAGASLQRMRAVSAALERQLATVRVQLEEGRRLKEEAAKANERYKAEFLSLQRKWQEREAEIRKQASDEAFRQLEADRVKLRLKAQEELAARVRRAEDELKREGTLDMAQREQILRERIERETLERLRRTSGDSDEARRKLEAELARKEDDLHRRDQAWQERLLKKETELLQMRSALDDARSRAIKEEEWKAVSARERLEIEKKCAAQDAELALLRKSLADTMARAAEADKALRHFSAERGTWEQSRGQLQAQAQSAARELEEARARAGAMERAAEEAKAEAAKTEQTWRAKLELERREMESRLKAIEAERDQLAKGQPNESAVMTLGRLKGLFAKKEEPPGSK